MQTMDRKRKRNSEAHRRFILLAGRFGFRKVDEYWVDRTGRRFAVPGMTDEEGQWMPDWQTGINRLMGTATND